MSVVELICPLDRCLCVFYRSRDLKSHINMHLVCQCVPRGIMTIACYYILIFLLYSWYRCPFCPKRYPQQATALLHVSACHLRIPDTPDTLLEGFDARYPLLTVWSLGMGLPRFKADGSRDAEMVVRNHPEQVWECARGSRQIIFRRPIEV